MSGADLVWLVPVMLLLLLLKGFFSGSEIALVSADKVRLSHRAKRGHRGARLVVELFERPERILAATLIGTNIATVGLTTLGTLTMIHFLGPELGDLYAFLLFTPLLLVLGEIVPKSVFQQTADRVAPIVVFPLRAFAVLFAPLVWAFSRVARLAAWLAGGGATSHHLYVTRDQLRALMEMADRAGGDAVFDRDRIERAIRFSEATVGAEMLPVTEMTTIDRARTLAEAVELVRRRGVNRLPVYEGDPSNIVGVLTLSTWDMLDPALADGTLAERMVPPHYVSPHDLLEELLAVLRDREDQLAIVVDEYGSTVGLITIEDILESVVGDIHVGFEFESGAPRRSRRLQSVGDDDYLADGRLPVQELNDALGLSLPATEFHTVAGLMVSRLRHLARPGESIVEAGYRFTVEDAGVRAVQTVRITRES